MVGNTHSGSPLLSSPACCFTGFSCSRKLGFLCSWKPFAVNAILSCNGEACCLQFLFLLFPVLMLEVLCSLLGHLSLWMDLNFCIPLFHVFLSIDFHSGTRLISYRFLPSSFLLGAEKMASSGAPGTRMTSAVNINISTPFFYNPQKKFAPVVAPKPKVNPFKAGDASEPPLPPPPGAGAQRAQIGKVGEIPSASMSLLPEGR